MADKSKFDRNWFAIGFSRSIGSMILMIIMILAIMFLLGGAPENPDGLEANVNNGQVDIDKISDKFAELESEIQALKSSSDQGQITLQEINDLSTRFEDLQALILGDIETVFEFQEINNRLVRLEFQIQILQNQANFIFDLVAAIAIASIFFVAGIIWNNFRERKKAAQEKA